MDYKKLFKIEEIENSKLLQVLFYIITASFFVTFYGWISSTTASLASISSGSYVCPPYFTECYKLFFYQVLPYGYSQNIFYVFLYLILLYGIVNAIRQDWEEAHKAIFISFIWKVVWIFLLSYGSGGNFDYYDMTLAFIWLFLTNKTYFSKLAFAWFYFMASTIKIHEGWIFGNYLNSLITGAPLFSENITRLLTNIVIFMQMVGVWFLFSKNKLLQKLSFLYFLVFHIYSGFIVSYRYITVSIPAIYVLFGKDKFVDEDAEMDFKVKRINRKTIAGYILLLFLMFVQFIAIMIPGDQKKTLEGNYYGLYMFESNHQCISNATIYFKDGKDPKQIHKENHISNSRCDPYKYFFPMREYCKNNTDIEKISWTFDHSINGHSFERIVDAPDLCNLDYKTFGRNEWIKIGNEAVALDRPVYKNGFGVDGKISLLHTPSTSYVNDNLLYKMEIVYWILWILSLCFVLYKLAKADAQN